MTQQPIFMASGEDPAMNRAFQLAKQTFRFYWRELSWERRRMIPGLEMDVVKLGFQDPPRLRVKGGLPKPLGGSESSPDFNNLKPLTS